MSNEKKCRVLLLIGNKLWNWNTVATFNKSELNIVGICVYDNSYFGLPINLIWKTIKRKGIFVVIDQIFGRIFYKVINFFSDKKRLKKIFNIDECNNIKKIIDKPVHLTKNYNNQNTLDWILKLSPDVIVVHSDGWVGKSIRNISTLRLIMGGHPGITPLYRGAHSPFWAIYNNEKNNIGYSIFHVDEGVDTGDLIFQEKLSVSEDETYMSISWRGMKKIAKKQVEVLEKYERERKILKKKHHKIIKESEYPVPGLSHYIRYLYIQKDVK